MVITTGKSGGHTRFAFLCYQEWRLGSRPVIPCGGFNSIFKVCIEADSRGLGSNFLQAGKHV